MNLQKYLEKIKKVCRQNNIKMLGVFGSVARNEETSESDIDLLVEFEKPVGLIELIQVEDKFVELFGRKVDLATENSLHPRIRQNVFNDLKILYETGK